MPFLPNEALPPWTHQDSVTILFSWWEVWLLAAQDFYVRVLATRMKLISIFGFGLVEYSDKGHISSAWVRQPPLYMVHSGKGLKTIILLAGNFVMISIMQ